jgi:hypothetical protein
MKPECSNDEIPLGIRFVGSGFVMVSTLEIRHSELISRSLAKHSKVNEGDNTKPE